MQELNESLEGSPKRLLIKVREALGFSQRHFALVIGKSFSAIRQYESGARRVTPSVLSGLMTLCISNGLIDLAREVEEVALGAEFYKKPKGQPWHLPADNHLQALLARLIQHADRETLNHVSTYLQMCLYWQDSPHSKDLKKRTERLHAPNERD